MDSPRASQGPRNGPNREKLTDALLRAAAVGIILDTIVPQLRARVAARVVSWQVVYWSRAVSGSRTYTIEAIQRRQRKDLDRVKVGS